MEVLHVLINKKWIIVINHLFWRRVQFTDSLTRNYLILDVQNTSIFLIKLAEVDFGLLITISKMRC
jgi:hypothetical protein